MIDKIRRTACALLLASVSAPMAMAMAQAPASTAAPFPCKVVRFIVPYPPGGASDLLARMLTPGLMKRVGTTVIVDNKGGAAGNIGTAQAITAKPDGCTWLLGNSSGVVISRNLYKLEHDPVEALVPVAEVAAIPMVLYVNAELPVKSVQELIDFLRANPDKHSYASPGSGTTHHLLGELLKLEFGITSEHVPYRGSGPAIQDVLAGHVSFAFEGTSAIVPHLDSGRIRALATTGEKRSASLPDLPTMKELGFPKFVVTNWYGVFAPKGMPPELVQRLNESVRETMQLPDVAEGLAKMDSQGSPYTAEQYQAFVKKEGPYWADLVKKTGAKVD